MPLTAKGEEILANMQKEYGAEKGKEVFYASKNAGKITGVDEAGLESALPVSMSHADLAAKSREHWEKGAARPAPSGSYGDSKPPVEKDERKR